MRRLLLELVHPFRKLLALLRVKGPDILDGGIHHEAFLHLQLAVLLLELLLNSNLSRRNAVPK